jgi:hypothetical protein
MELTITSDFAKHLFTRSKKDAKLARVLARQFLNSVEPRAMARFLLRPEVAEKLLISKVMQNPEQTLKELQALEGGRPERKAKRKAKRPGRPRLTKKSATPVRRRRRGRLSREQSESLKEQVKTFLARHRWSTRKELTAVVDLSTQAVYRRIMGELLEAGVVVSKGEKSKTTYALKKGRGAGKKTAKKKTAKKKTAKKKTAKKKTAKKPAAKKPAAKKKTAKKKTAKKPAAKKKAAKKKVVPTVVVPLGPSIKIG